MNIKVRSSPISRYIPPMSIKVLDHRNFGRKPIVGVHVIKSLSKFRVNREKEKPVVSNIEAIQNPEETSLNMEEGDIDKVRVVQFFFN
jgi:hypothetical protein